MFALINGEFEKENYLLGVKKNEDLELSKFNTEKLIKCTLYEYKAIITWYKISGNNVLNDDFEYVSKLVKKLIDVNTSKKEAEKLSWQIIEIYRKKEQRFSIKKQKNGKLLNFAFNQWSFSGYCVKRVDNIKVDRRKEFLIRLPKKSLFCENNEHWRVYLGVEDSKMCFFDSYNAKNVEKIPIQSVVEETSAVLIKGGKKWIQMQKLNMKKEMQLLMK